jgi:broad specificity phosphatase PhoE
VTTVLLVRHGATDWNLEKRAQGQCDIPLNDLGRSQAREVAAALSGIDLAAVYSSDLARARDTAEAIAKVHDLEVTTDTAFREIDQGDWTGLTDTEIRRRWPDRWGTMRHHTARPGGESPEQVCARALEGLRRVVEAHPDGVVAVVSHGAAIRTLVAEALGYRGRAAARVRGLTNGGIVSVKAERGAGSAGPQDERGAGSAGPQDERGAGSAGRQDERGAGGVVLSDLQRWDGRTPGRDDPNQ